MRKLAQSLLIASCSISGGLIEALIRDVPSSASVRTLMVGIVWGTVVGIVLATGDRRIRSRASRTPSRVAQAVEHPT